MEKVNVAILGSGNIGMNLLLKIKKSKILNCAILAGRNPKSPNLTYAKNIGVLTSANSIDALIEYKESYDIIFDATSVESHISNKDIFCDLNKFVINLTPSKVGKLCIPCLNMEQCLQSKEVNMVTCGGQSIIPIAKAIVDTNCNISYIEAISTISSVSAGIGTRDNIDEYIETTSQALRMFSGVNNTKVMIVINPAEPPILMRNTLYVVANDFNIKEINKTVSEMEKRIQYYVPGYKIIVPPTKFTDNIIAITIQVEGSGDFLPSFAGNLDIMTCASINVAEAFAYKKRGRIKI